MVKKLWAPCDPPQGYRSYRGPYRAWSHRRSDAVLIECPNHRHHYVDSGEWVVLSCGGVGRRVLGTRVWYGRSREHPPLTWANKVLAAAETERAA